MAKSKAAPKKTEKPKAETKPKAKEQGEVALEVLSNPAKIPAHLS